MGQLASFDPTAACIGEVRALKNMALGAVGSPVAEPAESEISAYRGTWGGLGVSIRTICLGTVALGVVKAVRHSLWSQLVRQVTRVPARAPAILEEVFAEGHFVRVVYVVTSWALGARTYRQKRRQSKTLIRTEPSENRIGSAVASLDQDNLPVVEKILQRWSTFLNFPDRLYCVSTRRAEKPRPYRWSWTILFATRFPVLVRLNFTPAITVVFGVAEAGWGSS